MSPRIKSTLLLAATLLLGAVLGGLVHAQMVEHRIERLAALRSTHGFVRFWEGGIEPTDAAQEEAVRLILEETAARVDSMARGHREEMHAVLTTTHERLAEVLTDEQLEQLERRVQMRRERGPRFRRRPGPHARPPLGPPPDSLPPRRP